MKKFALLLLLFVSNAFAQITVMPGPVLAAAPITDERITYVRYSVNGQEQSANCQLRALANGKRCPECDMTGVTSIGRITLTMKAYGTGVDPSADSLPVVMDISKSKCGKPNASGVVSCPLLYTPVPFVASNIGECTPAILPDVYKTPTSGTLRLFTASAGKLVSAIVGRSAPPSAICNCTIKIMSGTATYCPLANGPANEVTLCLKNQ